MDPGLATRWTPTLALDGHLLEHQEAPRDFEALGRLKVNAVVVNKDQE
jgi:hypothetical protein